jgi:hypothetical protein
MRCPDGVVLNEEILQLTVIFGSPSLVNHSFEDPSLCA